MMYSERIQLYKKMYKIHLAPLQQIKVLIYETLWQVIENMYFPYGANKPCFSN